MVLVSNKISWKLVCLVGAAAAAVVIVLILVLHNVNNITTTNEFANEVTEHIKRDSVLGNFSRAAVVTNGAPCATIAKQILQKGGKAVDGIIAAMICDGVSMPYSLGIGGGFFMVYYNRTSGKSSTIVAREVAPGAATEDMFVNNSDSSITGGLAVAVPGEIKGYWAAYENFGGGVPWKELFLPTIVLCEQGMPVNSNLARTLKKSEEIVKLSPGLRELFINPMTNSVYKEGDKYRNLKLARTLRLIAENGPDVFYNGIVGQDLVKDIQQNGGIITEEDLKNYTVLLEEPLTAQIFNNYTMHNTGPPSSGVILSYIMRILEGKLPADSDVHDVQRITEAFKYGFGARSQLGDPKFYDISRVMDRITNASYIDSVRSNISDTSTSNDPEYYGGDFIEPRDHGTGNLAVLAENGDAVVATSTVNLWFGSKLVSNRTGIILNDQMDDFGTPGLINAFALRPSKANFIAPGKRPLSSMAPTIITDSKGDVQLLIGAGGGSRIITSVAQVIIQTLVYDQNVKQAIDHSLFHHQLLPMEWQYYHGMLKHIIVYMKKIGHTVKMMLPNDFAALSGIQNKGDRILANSDYKRPGQVDGY